MGLLPSSPVEASKKEEGDDGPIAICLLFQGEHKIDVVMFLPGSPSNFTPGFQGNRYTTGVLPALPGRPCGFVCFTLE